MDEEEASNDAIMRYLDWARDSGIEKCEDPTERDIRRYLRGNPFTRDIRRFIESCRVKYNRYGKYTEIDEIEWSIVMLLCKELGMNLDDPHSYSYLPTDWGRNVYEDDGWATIWHQPILVQYQINQWNQIRSVSIQSLTISSKNLRFIHQLWHLDSLTVISLDERRPISLPLKELSLQLLALVLHVPSLSDQFYHLLSSVEFPDLFALNCASNALPIIHKCEELEILNVEFYRESDHDEAFDTLLAPFCKFHYFLQRLKIGTSSITQDQFERFLFQVVPRFPNLKILRFGPPWKARRDDPEINFISYLATAMDRMRSGRSLASTRISTSLRSLMFPSDSSVSLGRIERLGFIAFLKTFSTVENLKFDLHSELSEQRKRSSLHPDVKNALVTNMAGRRFFDKAFRGSSRRRNLKSWPLLLEAAQKDQRVEKQFPYFIGLLKWPHWRLQDGIFGLLREYPELVAPPLGDRDVAPSIPPGKRPRLGSCELG